MSLPVRRVALYGYLGSGKIGNDATFETVLAWLRSTQPDVEVRCITIAPEEIIARYGVPSVPLGWHSSRRGSNRLVRALRKTFGRPLDVPHSFALAGSVDAVIVPGRGGLEKNLGVGRLWGLPLWQFFIAVACRVRERSFVLLDDRVDIESARDVCAAILATRPSLPHDAVVVREFTTFAELTEEMMRAEVVIASRFHNLICALRLARPTISVGYARESRHFMETLGLGSYCQDIDHLNADGLVAQVLAARNAAGELANQIRPITDSYAAEAESLLDCVATEALGLAAWPSRRSL